MYLWKNIIFQSSQLIIVISKRHVEQHVQYLTPQIVLKLQHIGGFHSTTVAKNLMKTSLEISHFAEFQSPLHFTIISEILGKSLF